MSADEAAVVNYAMEFFQTHKVSQKTFQAAVDGFGAQHLTELTVLMGSYAQTAFILNAFEDSCQNTVPSLFCQSNCRRSRFGRGISPVELSGSAA